LTLLTFSAVEIRYANFKFYAFCYDQTSPLAVSHTASGISLSGIQFVRSALLSHICHYTLSIWGTKFMKNEQVISKLIEKNITISTAESCTGGLLGSIITSFPGVSSIYGYGFITYANEAKQSILSVPSETLEKYGAVSHQTACAMAKGARLKSGSDIAVSITGIAGPGGGSEEKPVGLVYVAISDKNGEEYRKLNLSGSREEVRMQTCENVLGLIDEKVF
jgi:nicotinamide-nucleotide amidase